MDNKQNVIATRWHIFKKWCVRIFHRFFFSFIIHSFHNFNFNISLSGLFVCVTSENRIKRTRWPQTNKQKNSERNEEEKKKKAATYMMKTTHIGKNYELFIFRLRWNCIVGFWWRNRKRKKNKNLFFLSKWNDLNSAPFFVYETITGCDYLRPCKYYLLHLIPIARINIPSVRMLSYSWYS